MVPPTKTEARFTKQGQISVSAQFYKSANGRGKFCASFTDKLHITEHRRNISFHNDQRNLPRAV